MHDTVDSSEIVSPVKWVNWAVELSVLWQDLKTELTKAEIEFLRDVNELATDNDISDTRAVKLAKTLPPKEGDMNSYQLFKYLEGRDKQVKEFILLAKKRAQLEEI